MLQEREGYRCDAGGLCSTVGAVYITNAESITNDHFCGLFSHVKIVFSTFFIFLHFKLSKICFKNQEKKVRKNFVFEVKN